MGDEKTVMSSEQAKQVLEQAVKERIDACSKLISDALKRYNCNLEATVLITNRGSFPKITIVPNE